MVAGRDSTASLHKTATLSRADDDGSLAAARFAGRDRGGGGARPADGRRAAALSLREDLGWSDGRGATLPQGRSRRCGRVTWRGRREGGAERKSLRLGARR